MDRKETDKLFRLLAQYYPNAKQLDSEDTKLAWALALRPYRYSDIRVEAISYATRGKFFPDLADLTAACVPQTAQEGGGAIIPPCMVRHVQELEELAEQMKEAGTW